MGTPGGVVAVDSGCGVLVVFPRLFAGCGDDLDIANTAFCLYGGVPEWLKGTGCKPVGYAYLGSNPSAPTTRLEKRR